MTHCKTCNVRCNVVCKCKATNVTPAQVVASAMQEATTRLQMGVMENMLYSMNLYIINVTDEP